jgi:hypothetical protein
MRSLIIRTTLRNDLGNCQVIIVAGRDGLRGEAASTSFTRAYQAATAVPTSTERRVKPVATGLVQKPCKSLRAMCMAAPSRCWQSHSKRLSHASGRAI